MLRYKVLMQVLMLLILEVFLLHLQKYMKFAEWYYREKIDFALDRMEFTQDKVFDLGFGHGGDHPPGFVPG